MSCLRHLYDSLQRRSRFLGAILSGIVVSVMCGVSTCVGQPANGQNYPGSEANKDDDAGKLVLLGILAASPFWAPPVFLTDDYATPGGFFGKPYPSEEVGHMSLGKPPEAGARRGMTSLAGEYGLDGDAERAGVNLLIDTWLRLGIDAEANWVSDVDKPTESMDFQTGDVNLLFRFAQHEQMQFRAGAGMRWLNDDWNDDYGVNLVYGVDWQPVRPLISSTVLEGGWLRGEGFSHVRTSLGVTVSHVEFLGGFDYLEVGAYQFTGPFLGLRLWY